MPYVLLVTCYACRRVTTSAITETETIQNGHTVADIFCRFCGTQIGLAIGFEEEAIPAGDVRSDIVPA
jgi:hypothetical protein